MRNKVITAITAAALALTLTGCGEDEKSSAPVSSNSSSSEKTSSQSSSSSASSSGSAAGDAPASSDSSSGDNITTTASVKVEVVNDGEVNIVVKTDFLKNWGENKVVYLAFWDGAPSPDSKEILVCRLDQNQKWVGMPEGDYSDIGFDVPESFPDGTVTFNVYYEGIEQLLRSSKYMELHTEDYTGENVATEQLIETNNAGEITSLFVSADGGSSSSSDTSSSSDPDTSSSAPSFTSADDFEWTLTSGGVMITGYKGRGGNVSIPADIEGGAVTQIGDYAFSNKSEITTITIPDSVVSIGKNAFEECNFASVKFGNSVRSIGEMAFARCYSLTSVVLPNSAVEFGRDVFTQCEHISSVTLPDTMTEIPVGMFAYCGDLKSIVFPSSVRSIATAAFYGAGIESLNIAGNIITIDESAFGGCRALKTVTVSNSVSSIGERAFAECSALEQASIPAVVSPDKLLLIFTHSEKVKVTCGGSTYSYEDITELFRP